VPVSTVQLLTWLLMRILFILRDALYLLQKKYYEFLISVFNILQSTARKEAPPFTLIEC